jgi:hypothetical protein
MMPRLAPMSLRTLPIVLAIACGPTDLTVGDKLATEGNDDAVAQGGSSSMDPDSEMPDPAVSEADPDPAMPQPDPLPPDMRFLCNNGSKIDASMRCNGKDECGDASDELDCPVEPFLCKNGSKIDANMRCNGKDECGDGSDELSCSTDPPEACEAGVEKAPPFDVEQKCWLPQAEIGCYKLIDPELSVPTDWGNTNCARRIEDGTLFWVGSPQLESEWSDCSPEELELIENAAECP